MSITITPIIVPARAPVHHPPAPVVPVASWKNKKRTREDDNGPFGDSKRPRTCPPMADALAYFTTSAWPIEESSPGIPCSSQDETIHSEDESSIETTDGYLKERIQSASDNSSSPTMPADAGSLEGFKFASDDDLLAWVLSIPDMGDEKSEEAPSPSTTDVTPSDTTLPPPPPMPIFAVDQELPIHYIPPRVKFPQVIRDRRLVDTEDLRRNVVHNLWWQRYYATERYTFLPALERDLPESWRPVGTPPRNADGHAKLDPPASIFKYTLCSDDTTSPAPGHGKTGARLDEYSASELFGPDADTVKVSRCRPIRPRAPVDLCELTTLEHTLRFRTDEPTETSAMSTVKMRADPCAVGFWKASVNKVVVARLEADVKAFFEQAADHDDDSDEDFEAVEIPDGESEAEVDVSFEYEYVTTVTVSESSSSDESDSEDGEGGFDYEQWVADYEAEP